jgi:hypothetical protein
MAENLWASEICLETYEHLMVDALLKLTGTLNPLVQAQFFNADADFHMLPF